MNLPQDTLLASGPVIIEDGKILLVRPNSSLRDFWVLPGGKVDIQNMEDPEDTCIREAKEELGIDIELVAPMRTLLMKRAQDETKLAVLIHFLAQRSGEPQMTDEILDFAWHDIDNLPDNTPENVRIMISDYMKMKSI